MNIFSEAELGLVLDKAILAINRYDHEGTFYSYHTGKNYHGSCGMCQMRLGLDKLIDENCLLCPFYNRSGQRVACNDHSVNDMRGYKARNHGRLTKEHQAVLITRLKNWCKKFHPDFEIVEDK